MKFNLVTKVGNINIYDIIVNNDSIGSIEIEEGSNEHYIENIHFKQIHRGKGYLKDVLNKFNDRPLKCLPLREHRPKFEHLGFKVCDVEGEDIHYIR